MPIKINYNVAVNEALKKYSDPENNNRGYHLGLFSKWRHSFATAKKMNKYDRLHELIRFLSSNDSDNARRKAILNFIEDSTLSYHSFACYLIDELVALSSEDKNEKHFWQIKDPNVIVNYDPEDHKEGTQYQPLYRGMRLNADVAVKIFNETGLKCNAGSKSVTASTHSYNYGISTSKRFECTLPYAVPEVTDLQTQRCLLSGEGYVFAIDPGKLDKNRMYDINKTSKLRREYHWTQGNIVNWFLELCAGFLAKADKEVNINQDIPADAITKMYKVNCAYEYQSIPKQLPVALQTRSRHSQGS